MLKRVYVNDANFSEIYVVSHLVTVSTEVRDPQAVAAACRRLHLPDPVVGTAKLFSAEIAGLLVKLPDWLYPVVCDTAKGELHYDNFGEAWGQQLHLDRFLQSYAVEKASLEARKRGLSVVEELLADGSLKLTVSVGGDS
jgi:hypothetical protein